MRWLWALVALLAACHASVHLLSHMLAPAESQVFGLKRFFDLGSEANLPSFVSALLLLIVAILLWIIGLQQGAQARRVRYQWWSLACVLAFLSVDEAAMIHDALVGVNLTRLFGRGDGVLHYNWYKLYVPLLLVLGLIYLPLLRQLNRRFIGNLALAVGVYLLGAVGLEAAEAYVVSRGLRGINVVRLFEESAEMAGLVLAVRALLLELCGTALRVEISDSRTQP